MEITLLLAAVALMTLEVSFFVRNSRMQSALDITAPGMFLMPCFLVIFVLPHAHSVNGAEHAAAIGYVGVVSFYVGINYIRLFSKIPSIHRDPTFDMNTNSRRDLILFMIGIGFYIVFFATRGVPLLSQNISVARADSVGGAGVILWPGHILTTFAAWSRFSLALALPKGSRIRQRIMRTAFYFILIATAVKLGTGWRGSTVHMLLGLVLIVSIKGHLRPKHILIVVAGILAIGMFGILRAYSSGSSIYDIDMTENPTFLDLLRFSYEYFIGRFQEHFVNFQRTVLITDADGLAWGRGVLMDVGILMPGGGQGLDMYLKERLNAQWIGGGGLPPSLLGSFYYDFGFSGVILLSVATGMLLQVWRSSLSGRVFATHLYFTTLLFAFVSNFGSVGQSLISYNLVMLAGAALSHQAYNIFSAATSSRKDIHLVPHV